MLLRRWRLHLGSRGVAWRAGALTGTRAWRQVAALGSPASTAGLAMGSPAPAASTLPGQDPSCTFPSHPCVHAAVCATVLPCRRVPPDQITTCSNWQVVIFPLVVLKSACCEQSSRLTEEGESQAWKLIALVDAKHSVSGL